MTATSAPPRPGRAAAAPRGFDRDRTAAAFVATAFVLLSTPQALNFFRLLPVDVLLLAVALHLASRSATRIGSVRLPGAGLALLGWCGLTVLWSDGPAITVVQTLATALALVVAAIVGTCCSRGAIVRGVLIGGLVVLALSLVVAAVDPADGLMPPGYQGGTLRGIYVHRNILGAVLTLALAAGLANDYRGRRPWLRRILACAALLGGVGLTASSTSIATSAAVLGVAALLALVRRARRSVRGLLLAAAAAVLAITAWLAVANSSVVFAFLHRDDTLTGRTLIWEGIGILIARRPWTGYGWGATWDPSDYVERWVSAFSKFQVPSAHNGYLDAWIQTGLVGLALFVLLLLVVLARGIRTLLDTRASAALFAPLLVTALTVHNISETNLVDPLVLFLLIACAVRLAPGRRRIPAAQPPWRRRPRSTTDQPSTAATV